MEDKLQKLRSAMDDTVFRDGELTETDKQQVREKIEKHEQRHPLNIFRLLGPWFKPVLSAAVCLLLLIGTLYVANNHQGEYSLQAGDFPYPKMLPEQEGKLVLLFISKKEETDMPIHFSNKLSRETISKTEQMSLRQAKANLSKLQIEKAPYYIFFDTNGVAFRTDDWKETGKFVVDYLKKKTDFPYPLLLSAEKGKFSILVNDTKNPTFIREIDESYGKVLVHGTFNPDARVRYPQLDIPEEKPYFIFFDTEGVAYRTGSEEEAEQFVRSQFEPRNEKFANILDATGISNETVIWVETYDPDNDDEDEEAFVIYQTKKNQVETVMMQRQNGRWKSVPTMGKAVGDGGSGFHANLIGIQNGYMIYGLAKNPDIDRILVNKNRPKTIQLDSGTFWYYRGFDENPFDVLTVYGEDGSILFHKSNISHMGGRKKDKK